LNIRRLMKKIEQEDVHFIQQQVPVQYDGSQKLPLGFKWRGEHYEVLKLLHKFKSIEGNPQYIVLTSTGIYCLAFEFTKEKQDLKKGRWLLKYKVNGEYLYEKDSGLLYTSVTQLLGKDNSNSAGSYSLLPVELANLAHYHGHVCPELAVGYRASVLARHEMAFDRKYASRQFAFAENMGSGIEAVQLITGCTIGNQNFFAYDLGKQVYYFGLAEKDNLPVNVLRLSLISEALIIEKAGDIEHNIATGKASQAEIEDYREAISTAVHDIIGLDEGELFKKSIVSVHPPRFQGQSHYSKCSICSEITDLKKCVPGHKGLYCQVCAKKQSRR
jgi:formylmethanofuran dehydrogenase subunit E